MKTRTFHYKNIIDEESGKVISLSTFAGKPVRGIAVCNKEDKFDKEYGIRLANARCSEKIATKRYITACSRYLKLVKEREELNNELESSKEYVDMALSKMRDASKELVSILCESI